MKRVHGGGLALNCPLVSAFGDGYGQVAQPFEWIFACGDLDRLLAWVGS